jgi:hypothetical protein
VRAPASSSREIHLLLRLVDEAFNMKAWHGPGLRGSIKGVDARLAAWRPAPERRNIWEIVVHAAYWKYTVRRRLRADKKGSFPLKGSNWFGRPLILEDQAWRADIRLLEEMHRSMREAIAALDPADLALAPAGSKLSHQRIIAGIVAHDVYHAGQIQLLKRLGRGLAPVS